MKPLKLILPLIAVAGVGIAAVEVSQSSRPVEQAVAVAAPPVVPFDNYVAGAGLVEARTRNVAVAATLPGVVTDVYVAVGEAVAAGAPLFRVDSRSAEAQVAVRQAALVAAESELARLVASPRPEDLPPARARVAQAQATFDDAAERLQRLQAASEGGRAVSTDELRAARRDAEVAEARLAETTAELSRLEAGAWAADLAIAQAAVQQARANLAAAETDVTRLLVRSPVAGRVLQVNVREGEYASAGGVGGTGGGGGDALMVVGDTTTLHVRVDIDENDAWRLTPGKPARAFVRGNGDLSTDLSFVRVEPFVIPKRSLTGESTERVDTRVLQVVYAFDPAQLPVYVGQQMDVYVEAGERPGP
ncbi:MAG: HlyD family secretion protein [Phycisphaerae bacterium]